MARPSTRRPFRGQELVVVIADKDAVGRDHAVKVAKTLRDHVERVVIAEARAGKDAFDHLAAGFGVDDFVLADDSGGAVTASTTAELLERACTALRRVHRLALRRTGRFRGVVGAAHLRL